MRGAVSSQPQPCEPISSRSNVPLSHTTGQTPATSRRPPAAHRCRWPLAAASACEPVVRSTAELGRTLMACVVPSAPGEKNSDATSPSAAPFAADPPVPSSRISRRKQLRDRRSLVLEGIRLLSRRRIPYFFLVQSSVSRSLTAKGLGSNLPSVRGCRGGGQTSVKAKCDE